MTLKELLKKYYGAKKEVNTSSEAVRRAYKELVLPGTFHSTNEYRRTISWNLDRNVFYREAVKEDGKDDLYVTITTGKMDFYFVFDNDEEFLELLNSGLKKHRDYRKENLPWEADRKYLFYSRKYER